MESCVSEDNAEKSGQFMAVALWRAINSLRRWFFGPITTYQIISFLIAIQHSVYTPNVPLLYWLFCLSKSAIVFREYRAIKNAGFKSVVADVTWATDDSGERDISEMSNLRQRLFEGISIAWAIFGAILLLTLAVAVLSRSYESVLLQAKVYVAFHRMNSCRQQDLAIASLLVPFSLIVYAFVIIWYSLQSCSFFCCHRNNETRRSSRHDRFSDFEYYHVFNGRNNPTDYAFIKRANPKYVIIVLVHLIGNNVYK